MITKRTNAFLFLMFFSTSCWAMQNEQNTQKEFEAKKELYKKIHQLIAKQQQKERKQTQWHKKSVIYTTIFAFQKPSSCNKLDSCAPLGE